VLDNVEGMPLAIELAAAWTKTISCTEIAQEIQRNLDFLASNVRNLPERHRSMQAIFEQSSGLLTAQERLVFQRLSVFRGGFKRRAAEQVVGASLALLSALVNKSLLQWDSEGRYQLHELLRQYAHEQLEQSPEATKQVRERHCRFYANFAYQNHKDLTDAEQSRFPAEIAGEIENIRQAWAWAVRTADSAMICRLADPLQQYYGLRGRCLEGIATLRIAIQRLKPLVDEEQKALALAFVLNLLRLTQSVITLKIT
jgi:predicted ATPase